jgi:hypothetical protein
MPQDRGEDAGNEALVRVRSWGNYAYWAEEN